MACRRRRTSSGAIRPVFLLMVLMAIHLPTWAAERLYVSQLNPYQFHAFSFQNGEFQREDLDLSSPAMALRGGLGAWEVAVTDRFVVAGNSFQGIPVSLLDPVTGAELPRVAGTATGNLVLSADKKVAYTAFNSPILSVINIDPASGGFLTQAGTISLGSGFVWKMLVHEDKLYVARVDGDLALEILVYSLVNPLAPSPIGVSDPIPPSSIWANNVNSMQISDVGGTSYLSLTRYNLQLVPLDANGIPDADGTVSFAAHATDLGFPTDDPTRSAKTHLIVDTADGPRALVHTTTCIDNIGETCGAVGRSEILVWDLAGTLVQDPDPEEPNKSKLLAWMPTDDCGDPNDVGYDKTDPGLICNQGPYAGSRIFALSEDGATAYLMMGGFGPAYPLMARLQAYSLAALMAVEDERLTPAWTDEIEIDPATPIVQSVGFAVGPEIAAPADGPVATSATTDVGATPTNEDPHLVSVFGSALSSVTQSFLGLTRLLPPLTTSSTSASATMPELTAAGNFRAIVMDGPGRTSQPPDEIQVNNPERYLPGTLIYTAASGSNEVKILNAATSTEVIGTIPTPIQQPVVEVSKDGRHVFVGGFRDGRVLPYVVGDPLPGQSFYDPVGSPLAVGGVVRNMIQSRDGDLLFANVNDGIVVLDARPLDDGDPLEYIDADANGGTTSAYLPTGISRIDVRTNAFTMQFDEPGNWLFVTRDRHQPGAVPGVAPGVGWPRLVAFRIDASNPGVQPLVTAACGIGVGTGFSSVTAGIAVRGSLLYVTTANEDKVRVFEFNSAGTDCAGLALTERGDLEISLAGAPTDTRNLAITPDGALLNVSSRIEGTVRIIDLADGSLLATLPTGSFTNSIATNPSADPDKRLAFAAVAQNDQIVVIDERPGSDTLYEVLTTSYGGLGTANLSVSLGVTTPEGGGASLAAPDSSVFKRRVSSSVIDPITVRPTPSSRITFSSVTTGGSTTVTSSNVSDVPFDGAYTTQGSRLNVYYDVNTTAVYSGPVLACFVYDDSGLPSGAESTLKLMHEESGSFVDRTTSLDTDDNEICAEVTSFSQFVVAEPLSTVLVDVKPGTSRNTINLKAKGLLSVAILSSLSFNATQVDPATVKVAGSQTAKWNLEDANGDSLIDLVVRVPIESLQLTGSSTSATLMGRTFAGVAISGSDSVTITPK